MLVHGKHGIGKTEIIKQFAAENDYNCVALYLSTQDVSDLVGLPIKDETTYGKTVTEFAEPAWLRKAKEDDRPCIFYLDEMNRAPQYVLQTMLPFALDGIIHTHSIREKDVVIAAMNPDCAEYNVESLDDKALLSRFAHIYLEPGLDEFNQYCINTNCHPALMEVLQSNHGKTIADGKTVMVQESDKIKATPDRRSLWKIGQALNILEKSEVEKVGYHLISSLVGGDLAAPLIKAYKEGDQLSLDDVLKGKVWKKYGKTFDMEKHIDKVASISDELKSSILNGMNDKPFWEPVDPDNTNAEKFLTENAKPEESVKLHINQTAKRNLKRWMKALPVDHMYSIVHDLKQDFMEKYDKAIGCGYLCGIFDHIDPSIVDTALKIKKERVDTEESESSEDDS